MNDRTRITFTGPQARQVDWAEGPMHDYAACEDSSFAPGDWSWDPAERTLEVDPGSDAVDDLLYRLEVQLPQMATDTWGTVRPDLDPGAGNTRAARNAADRIRAATAREVES